MEISESKKSLTETVEDIVKKHFGTKQHETAVTHNHTFLNVCVPTATEEEKNAARTIGQKTAMIVLNSNVGSMLEPLWCNAAIRICADGGTNRVRDKLTDKLLMSCPPSTVVGDMDGIRSDVMNYCKQKEVDIIEDKSQDLTDLEKCLIYLQKQAQSKGIEQVIVYGAFSGRLDHEMANIHAIMKFGEHFKRVVMLNDENLVEYLKPGHHLFLCHESFENINTRCAILPIGKPCQQIFTQGLKWNLDGRKLEFGDLISTSNQIVAHHVHIENSDPVVFMMTPTLVKSSQGVPHAQITMSTIRK